jgi:hypothetical protein
MTGPRHVMLAALPVLVACSPGSPVRGDAPLAASSAEAVARDSAVAVMDRLTSAADRKDIDAFMALWEHSDSVVYTRSGRTFVGWEEIKADHARAFSSPDRWEFVVAETHARGLGAEAGVGTAFVRTTDHPADGAAQAGWFTITIIARATPSGWRAVQGHGSYPDAGVTPRGDPEQ